MAPVLAGRAADRPTTRVRDGTGPLAMTLIVLGFVVVWLAAVVIALRLMMLPADAAGRLYVVFPPATGPDQAFSSILEAGGRPVGPALGSWTWEAFGEEPGFVARLEDQGALVALRTTPLGIPLAGCLGVLRSPEQRPGFTPGL